MTATMFMSTRLVNTHYGIVSGFSSAIYGANIVPKPANMLQIPLLVATRVVGNIIMFARYAALYT